MLKDEIGEEFDQFLTMIELQRGEDDIEDQIERIRELIANI